MKDAFNESLFKFLKIKLEEELDEVEKYQGDDYAKMCDDLIEAIELCDKLLTYDYFKDSEDVIDTYCKQRSFNRYLFMCKNWRMIYNFNINEKKKDMKKLFSIIANNCEDWC